MADRQWFAEGVQLYETGEEEYFAEGVQVCEDQGEEGVPSNYLLTLRAANKRGNKMGGVLVGKQG